MPKRPLLVIIGGPNGAGKTTLAQIARIRTRGARGGHFVPDDDVRRRFGRSLRNFWYGYRLQAHRWQLQYNGPPGLTEAARGEGETMEVLDPEAFRTFERVLEAFR